MQDWKTTLFGIIEAVIIAALSYIYGYITGDYAFSVAGFGLALARAIGAYFTRDKKPAVPPTAPPEVK